MASRDQDPASKARRQFLIHSGTLATGAAASPYLQGADATAGIAPAPAAAGVSSSPSYPLRLIVNGSSRELNVDARVTLLDALREYLGMPGTKKGCDRGQCGACTVLVNGRRINSCMTLALTHEGDEVVTIEGLGNAGMLHPMQEAFLVHDGYQCGYCTPGQICSAVAMLDEARAGSASAATGDVRVRGPVPLTDGEIRERMSGNICRCGAYVGIVASVRAVAGSA
jgi:xanthine dehydrogenase YagT iron-sulfur-binding subunit